MDMSGRFLRNVYCACMWTVGCTGTQMARNSSGTNNLHFNTYSPNFGVRGDQS